MVKKCGLITLIWLSGFASGFVCFITPKNLRGQICAKGVQNLHEILFKYFRILSILISSRWCVHLVEVWISFAYKHVIRNAKRNYKKKSNFRIDHHHPTTKSVGWPILYWDNIMCSWSNLFGNKRILFKYEDRIFFIHFISIHYFYYWSLKIIGT